MFNDAVNVPYGIDVGNKTISLRVTFCLGFCTNYDIAVAINIQRMEKKYVYNV